MIRTKVGFVGVASPYEFGGERGPELIKNAVNTLKAADMDVVAIDALVETPAQAIAACDKFNEEEIDCLVIMDVTWVIDSLKFVFTQSVKVPTVFWAIPYTETFSIGCIQYYGSALKAAGFTYKYVYGLPGDEGITDVIKSYSVAGRAVRQAAKITMALVGPRQTWRVAGPQDTTSEEWEFVKKTGIRLIHLEMEEITNIADKYSDEEAKEVLAELAPRTAKSVTTEETMLYMAKVYKATKQVIADNKLTSMAAECYPNYCGLMNLTASWIADEGTVVDTEGDIAHAYIMEVLNTMAGGGACALGESGSFDFSRNVLSIAHEGSTAMSLAGDLSRAQINQSGEKGAFVGVPLKAMDEVTITSVVGNNGNYKVLVAKARTLDVTHEEWVAGGSKLIVNLQFDQPVRGVMDKFMEAGLHHHIIIKEGDLTQELEGFCDYMGYEVVRI